MLVIAVGMKKESVGPTKATRCAHYRNKAKHEEEYSYRETTPQLRDSNINKKIPAIPKDHRETPQVGVDGFEPPTLCL